MTTTLRGDKNTSADMDMKLEVIVIPVSDVDRSKQFYANLGWRVDADFASEDGFRVVQLTPPGSPCSVIFGRNVTSAPPGSAQGLYLVVADIMAARDELLRSGVRIGEIFHASGDQAGSGKDTPFLLGTSRLPGTHPQHASYRSFASFSDPDGNGWLLQEVTSRLPGRVDAAMTSFASRSDLAGAFRRAEAAHAKHEAQLGHRDESWPEWYAAYIVAEQSGAQLPS